MESNSCPHVSCQNSTNRIYCDYIGIVFYLMKYTNKRKNTDIAFLMKYTNKRNNTEECF